MDETAEKPRIRPVEAFPVQENGQMHFVIRDPYHYSDASLTLTPGAALIVRLLDGTNTILDIQTTMTRAGGTIFPSDKIREVIRVLDDCYFLDNDRFADHKRRREESFTQLTYRPSAMAGKSYPADPEELRALLDEYFSQPDPAGILSSAGAEPVLGVVSPHIDFSRGGPTYVPAYRALQKSTAQTFVILGISHAGGDTPLIPTRKDFETPLGMAETDRDVLDRMERKLRGRPGWERMYAAEYSHAHEHSIEFQTVFLQYIMSTLRPSRPYRILPILCAFSHEEVQREAPDRSGPIFSFLDALSASLAECGRSVAYIAGVDFAHVGSQFGDTDPIQGKDLSLLKDHDEQMMALLCAGGAIEFHKFIHDESNQQRVCGYPALYTLLSILPPDAATAGRVLKYGQWPDPNGTVTFGSLSFSASGPEKNQGG